MSLRGKVGALLLLVMVIGVACGGDDGGSETTDTNNDAADTEADTGGAGTLVTANFAFDPSTLTAAAGDTIEFTNEDDTKHNFTAEDAGLDVDADAGGSATIDLADVESGSYDFYCKYHKDSMTGTLEVTE